MDNEEIAYQPGDVLLDKFKVDRILGVGGFGAVLAATHVQLEEKVAIKVLLPHATKNPQASERFIREARAAVRIKSEHVARVSDVGQLPDGTPYMVMEYLEGQDLSDVLQKHGPQSVSDVAEWVLQACEALAEAHSLGIIHRDLKPANLYLTRKVDGVARIKVLDFGISKLASDTEMNKGMTKTSDVMGSPYYMSPEQMRSTRNVDARSDIWALGAILFELLAGVTPFDAETMTALVVAIMSEHPRELNQYRNDVPPGLRDVILTCLQKDPAHRFPDIGSFAHALSQFAPQRAHGSVQRVMAVTNRLSALPSAPQMGNQAGPNNAVAAGMTTGPTMQGLPVGAQPPGAYGSGQYAQAPAQSWGGTVAGSQPIAGPPQKSPMTGLIVAGVIALAGLGAAGAYWFVIRDSGSSTNNTTASTSKKATSDPDDDDDDDDADPGTTATVSATASATVAPSATIEPSASVSATPSETAPSASEVVSSSPLPETSTSTSASTSASAEPKTTPKTTPKTNPKTTPKVRPKCTGVFCGPE